MPIHPDTCNGPCSTNYRRAWRNYEQAILDHADAIDAWAANGEEGEPPAEPDEPDLTPRFGEPLFCGMCKRMIAVALNDLDYLASELSAIADGHRGGVSEGRVSGSRTSGSPSPTADLLDKLYSLLADTEDEWRATWGWPTRTDRAHRGAHPRTRRIGWLLDHLEGILGRAEHVQFGLDVLRWEIVLRNRRKEDSVGTRSPIRCPRCSQLAQVVRQKEGHWQCGACTLIMSDATEHQQRQDQADELEAAAS